MSITYYMLQIPPIALFIILIVVGGILSGGATYLFRKYVQVKVLRSHNEVTGFFFLAIASFYAFLLGFVVLAVFAQLSDTQNNVSKEGSAAMGLYRDIKFYPDTADAKQLLSAYLQFVYNVIDDEFPKMERMQQSRLTPESLNTVFHKIERLEPKTPFQIQLVTVMFNHLNELTAYRGLRTAAIESEIPAPMWLPIVFGAILTCICAMFLDIEYIHLHVALNALLGIFIAMFLFMIIILDHPFTGSLGIKPKAYKQIFTTEQWTQELPANKSVITL